MKISPDKIQKSVRVRIYYVHVLVYIADLNLCSRQIKTNVHNYMYNVSGIHIHFNPRSSFCTFYAFLRGGTFFVDTKVT